MRQQFATLPAPLRGAGYMLVATVFWAGLTILVRMVSARYSVFEILFFRNLVSMLILLPWMLRVGRAGWATRRAPMHLLRTAFAYLGMLGMFYGIARIPLADVVALGFTQPLFISLLAIIVLGEAATGRRSVALVAGFVGVWVIVRPGFAGLDPATWIVLGSSLVYAGSNICIKVLMSTDSPVQAVIYVNMMMLPLSLAPAALDWVTPGWPDLVLMAGIGITGALGVYFASRAYAAADASAVVPYDFMRLPLAAAGAYVLFNEVADAWTWVGALIIFGSSYALALAERSAGRT